MLACIYLCVFIYFFLHCLVLKVPFWSLKTSIPTPTTLFPTPYRREKTSHGSFTVVRCGLPALPHHSREPVPPGLSIWGMIICVQSLCMCPACMPWLFPPRAHGVLEAWNQTQSAHTKVASASFLSSRSWETLGSRYQFIPCLRPDTKSTVCADWLKIKCILE